MCVVTGAAQGIGRGIVQAFLDEGARVFAADVRDDGLEQTRALAPDRVTTHAVDLADFEARRRWRARRSSSSVACTRS